MPFVRRKGFGVIECVILTVVLLVSIGAIFATMAAAQRSYTFHKLDRDSRELLFNWVQTFESLWPPDGMAWTSAAASAQANVIIQEVGNLLGTYANGVARVGVFTVAAAPGALSNGSISLNVTIREGDRGRTLVNLTRSYNIYTTETVSDDIFVFVED